LTLTNRRERNNKNETYKERRRRYLYPIAIPTKHADNLSRNVEPAGRTTGGVICGVGFVVAVSKGADDVSLLNLREIIWNTLKFLRKIIFTPTVSRNTQQ
jgi:hypothetical protein